MSSKVKNAQKPLYFRTPKKVYTPSKSAWWYADQSGQMTVYICGPDGKTQWATIPARQVKTLLRRLAAKEQG